ncbi:MAG: hypothetical protein DI536_18935 [Archangium gephyra]|uniref:Outer membrane protein beta-barrel domain-containing protein n=1 Tax=Archangium gephyra TaxID=48 RepID=A0A2W5V4T1_9BACT|nr:MAG: hypothetical protein DI536_18935 [Archangium gephyra]
MKHLILVATLVSTVSFAQEIGSEIEPATPPPAPPAQSTPLPARGVAPEGDGQLSAGKGSFGIRGSFTGGSSFIPAATGTATNVGATNLGVGLLLTDNLKLIVDLGVGLSMARSTPAFGFGVGAGVEILLRQVTDALRPVIHVSAHFGGQGNFNTVRVGARVGFGAEYFFSKHFSLNGLLAIDLPFDIGGSNVQFAIVTASPGIGATFYF